MLTSNQELKAGNYFQRRETPKPTKKEHFKAGDLVLVIEVDLEDQEVSYTAYADNKWWTQPIDDFLRCFKYEGEGRAIREREFNALLGQASAVADEITEESMQLQGIENAFKPLALPGLTELPDQSAEAAEQPANDQQVGLARVNNPSQTLLAANQFIDAIAERRDRIGEKKDRLNELQRKIAGIQAEQKAWMECITKFTDISKRLNQVILNLNLYLGADEEIIQLAAGKPVDGPLVIRQLVLFMDEECALYAEKGGIDARSISEFDNWLLDDIRNLDQVLPEQKGIVCIKPRRSDKDYGDSFINMKMNKANKETYILIRNGENVFRLLTGWATGAYFFPCMAEFEELEQKHVYDSREHRSIKRKLTPEDGRDYREMLKKRDELEQHYSRALILLQGIVDRTGIFPDLQNLGLNLLDITANNQYLRFIHDGDPSKLLVTGRETFQKWQRRTNALLQAGDRIMGNFSYPYTTHDGLKYRMRSAYSGSPDSHALYTLEKGSDGLRIYFESDSRDYWNGYEYVKRKNRLSYKIQLSDDNIIAFDQITLEDAQYFLNDRLSRHAYADMFPLLRLIRNMKQIERNEEQPFIDLLINEAGKHTADHSGLDAQIREVIQWYKFKNKTHRSLAQDDAKAFRMIIKEWQKRRLTEQQGPDSAVLDAVRTDATLLIALRDQEIIHIERADRHQIFVHRTDLKRVKDELRVIKRREWMMIGQEYLMWQIIYEAKEWAEWPKGSRVNRQYLTTPELESFLEVCKQRGRELVESRSDYFLDSKEKNLKGVSSHLCRIDLYKDQTIQLYYYLTCQSKGAVRYTEMSAEITWRRHKDQLMISDSTYHGWATGSKLRNSLKVGESWNPDRESSFIYFLDHDAIAAGQQIAEQARAEQDLKQTQQWLAIKVFMAATADINAKREAVAKAAYVANHGDPRLWQSYKDRAKLDSVHHMDLFEEAIGALQRAFKQLDISEESQIENLTLEQIMEMAKINLKSPPPELDLSSVPISKESDEEIEESDESDELDDWE